MISKLAVKKLNFGYHGPMILKDFFMDIGDGQIVSIVGPNGSGKSTLIKCIDRILVPLSGDIMVDRQDIDDEKRQNCCKRPPKRNHDKKKP